MKIEVKDKNIEQALRVLKRKLQRDGFFKVVKLKKYCWDWLRGTDLNRRPSGYEPDELPDCSTPRYIFKFYS